PSLRSRKDPGYSRAASRAAGGARAVLCWNDDDWTVLEKVFDSDPTGFVAPVLPHRLSLAPTTCAPLDKLAYAKPPDRASTGIATAVLALGREIWQSRGDLRPARSTCYGLQLVPSLSKLLGAGPAYARRPG